MNLRSTALKVLFLIILGILFALLGYLGYPYIFECVIGSGVTQVTEQGPTSQNGMGLWSAALGIAIGVGTLLCSVESSKKQVLFSFIFLLVLAVGFAGVWVWVMKDSFSSLIQGSLQDPSLNMMDYASFYEIPQFASIAVLVLSLIVFIKKTKDH